jgi:hypothetical protein
MSPFVYFCSADFIKLIWVEPMPFFRLFGPLYRFCCEGTRSRFAVHRIPHFQRRRPIQLFCRDAWLSALGAALVRAREHGVHALERLVRSGQNRSRWVVGLQEIVRGGYQPRAEVRSSDRFCLSVVRRFVSTFTLFTPPVGMRQEVLK